MRVLVVDDEEFIRRGIANKIKRIIPYVTDVYQSADAYEAIHMIGEIKPNVVVTDIRMPEIDGLSFIEQAIKIDDSIKFIIISGYQEFEYARKAIQLQVEGYLLKPIENEQLKELFNGIHNKLCDQLESQNYISQLKHQAKDGTQLMQNKYLMDLVYSIKPSDIEGIMTILKSLGVDFKLPYYSVIVVKIINIDCTMGLTSYEDKDTIKFIIRNIVQEMIESSGMKAVVFEDLHVMDSICAIVNYNRFWHDNQSKQKEYYKQIVSRLQQLAGIYVRIGCGRSCNETAYIGESYQEAHTAAIQLSSSREDSVTFISEVPLQNTITFFLDDHEKMLLISYIRENDNFEAIRIIDNIFDMIEKHKLSSSNIKILSLEILMIITKFIVESGMSVEKLFTQNICSEDYISQYSSLEQLREAIKRCIETLCEYMTQIKRSDGETAIEEIRKYIDQYYYMDINLSQMANKYFINPSYLSQLFKIKTGKKFVDYITSVRIEKAKELLITTNLKTYKIAEIVGYNNSRYFSEVFVKYEEVTPTQFRQRDIEAK